jgi:hypothetical protein
MANIDSGGSMRRPEWSSMIRRNPDYDNDRVVIVDAQTYLDGPGRGPKRQEVPGFDRWNDDLSWFFSSRRSEVRVKRNSQIYREIGGEKVPASLLPNKKAFIDDYRSSEKIILDTAACRSSRLAACRT